MQLESNPTANQTELETKKQQLKELQTKEKELTKSLPLSTQITLLEKEIKELENKSTRTQAEEALLTEKKQQLAELLTKQNSSDTTTKPKNKNVLYVGCGLVGIFLLLGIFIWTRVRKRSTRA